MKLKILGTGGATPSLQRLSSSYLVTTKGGRILVDIGPSVVRRLLETGSTYHDIDVIILTHFHPDHTIDLGTFLFACAYGEPPRTRPLTLVGGEGVDKFYRKLCLLHHLPSPETYKAKVKVLPQGEWTLGPTSIRTTKTNHKAESIGIRIDEEKSLVFSGDTDYSRNLVQLARNCDLLVAECTYPEVKVRGHLNLETLTRIVWEAHPREVVLSHLRRGWEDYRAPLPKPLLLGEDGMEIEL